MPENVNARVEIRLAAPDRGCDSCPSATNRRRVLAEKCAGGLITLNVAKSDYKEFIEGCPGFITHETSLPSTHEGQRKIASCEQFSLTAIANDDISLALQVDAIVEQLTNSTVKVTACPNPLAD